MNCGTRSVCCSARGRITVVPFFNLTRPRYNMHFEAEMSLRECVPRLLLHPLAWGGSRCSIADRCSRGERMQSSESMRLHALLLQSTVLAAPEPRLVHRDQKQKSLTMYNLFNVDPSLSEAVGVAAPSDALARRQIVQSFDAMELLTRGLSRVALADQRGGGALRLHQVLLQPSQLAACGHQ